MRRSTALFLPMILLLALSASLHAQQSPGVSGTSLTPPKQAEFVDLQAVQIGHVAKLVWQVEGPVSNKYFELERSADLQDWTILATVPGGFDEQSITTYVATDPSPAKGLNYYRIRQVDFEDRASYSPIIAHSTISKRMTAFPNPATGPVQVVGPQSPSYALYGSDGETYPVQWQKLGLGHHAADLSALPTGRYLLVEQSTGQQLSLLKP